MNAPTSHARDLDADWRRGYAAGYEAGATCSVAGTPELPTCSESEKPFLRNRPILSTTLESCALSHLTDAQALATWERMKAVRTSNIAKEAK